MICTYLYDYEFVSFTKVEDIELNELFQEVREKFGNRHLLQERKFPIKKWKGIKRIETYITLYQLYVHTIASEVQIVNFATDSESSISGFVRASYIYTYFYGLLSGLRYAELQTSNIKSC